VLKTFVLLGIVVASAANEAPAQDRRPKYSVGIRSGLITRTMKLSRLDPAFDNLAPHGPKGPHMSGYFFLFAVRPNLWLGAETLVANSEDTLRTSMNYQAAGPVVQVSYGESWFISGGVHAGGLVVDAVARHGAAPSTGAATGSFFKGDGLFAAPFADVGYRFRGEGAEVGLFIKRVNIFGERERGGISEFSSTFGGLRVAFRL
jgi:hypothetical protein